MLVKCKRPIAARTLLLCCWLGCCLYCRHGAVLAGEKDQIVTDRPDFVESSDVVGQGRVQIETSVALERYRAGGVSTRTVSSPTLLRIGIGDSVELRVESEGRVRAVTRVAGAAVTTDNGYADTALGIKWHAFDARGALPSVGLLLHADFDSGSAPFRAPGKGGSLRLAAEWDLPGEYALGIMPGLATQRNDDGRRFTAGIFGIVLGKAWNERLRTFVEYSAPRIARARDGGSVNTVDVGAAYLLADTVQIDTALSRGLNRNTPDWSWSAGLSIKF
jgi:hypothetical protein